MYVVVWVLLIVVQMICLFLCCVYRISEHLLEECLTDVAGEMEHICDNYVEDQIYSREFAQA